MSTGFCNWLDGTVRNSTPVAAYRSTGERAPVAVKDIALCAGFGYNENELPAAVE